MWHCEISQKDSKETKLPKHIYNYQLAIYLMLQKAIDYCMWQSIY